MAEARYQFGTPARGVLLGLRPVQLAGVMAGLALAGLSLATGAPVPVALGPLVAAGTWCWARLGERQVHEWAGPTTRQGRGLAAGRRWRAEPASVTIGSRPSPGRSRRPRLPRELAGLHLDEVHGAGLRLGVAAGARGISTVVLGLRAPEGFALAEAEEQAGLVAAWSRVLAGLGSESSALRRLCWVERAEPGAVTLDESWCAPTGLRAPGGDYAALAEQVRLRAVRHEAYLGLQLRARREELGEVATALCRQAADLLAGADIAARPLRAPELEHLIRRWADPVSAVPTRPAEGPSADTSPVRARELGWSEVRIDGAFHRSWVVTAWPKSPVGPAWFEPLLSAVPAGAARSFAVHLRPVPSALASRRARARRLNARLDQAQRARWGFDVGARQAAELEEASAREEELVGGHAAHRVVGVLGVSAAGREALDGAARSVEQVARAVGLDIRCCYGAQPDGWAATLPLCRVREARGS